jgi:S-phase kinase-associated protein 1
MSGKLVTLESNDGVKVVIPIEVANLCVTLRNLLEFQSDRGEQGGKAIPLPNISADCLKVLCDYGKDYLENKPPKAPESEPGATKPLVFAAWEEKYKVIDPIKLTEMAKSASYIEFPEYLDLCVRAVASHIKGKKTEEIRATFKLVNDFTPEEEEALKKEHAWIEETA